MNLYFNTENLIKDIPKENCHPRMTKHQDVSFLASVISLRLIPAIKGCALKSVFKQSEAFQYHKEVENIFKKYIDHLFESNLLRKKFVKILLETESERMEVFSEINKKSSLYAFEYKKIESKIWKSFLGAVFSSRGIELVLYKSISLEKRIRKRFKKSDCAYFAFYQIQDLFLATMFCKTKSKDERLITLTKKIRDTVTRDKEKWDEEVKKWSKMLKDRKLLIPLIINYLKYEIVFKQAQGDLIVYLDNQDEWEHFGYCLNSKYIESKWGSLPVFKHLTEESPYNNNYLILRKPV